jgi:pimeloyl-ACP methyl ester carboxylesterase
MYLASQVGWSTTQIGKFYSGRDHSTVDAIGRIRTLRETDPELDCLLTVLTNELRDRAPSKRKPTTQPDTFSRSRKAGPLVDDGVLDALAERIADRSCRNPPAWCTQTSRMWRPLMEKLKEKFTIIAPDLPGIGDSDIPKNGCDMKTAAIRVHDLAKSLGITKARVVGHDIGLMVAYAYAAQFPAEVEKLVVMDAFLPGVAGWELAYNNPNMWHFRFNGATPEALVKNREKIYFAYFWNDLAADKRRSLPTADRSAYVAAYSRPGRMRAGWAYFAAWPDTAKDFAQMAKAKLAMPVLSIAGEKASAAILGPQMKLVAKDVTVMDLKDTGHWLMEERPDDTMKAIVAFL